MRCPSPLQRAQGAIRTAVGANKHLAGRLARTARHGTKPSRFPESIRSADDAFRCRIAAAKGDGCGLPPMSIIAGQRSVTSCHSPFDGYEPAQVRRRYCCHCTLARPRGYRNNACLSGSGPGDKASGLGAGRAHGPGCAKLAAI